MLIVKIELHSAIDGHVEEIARMRLFNDGTGDRTVGNYTGQVFRGRSFEALDKAAIHKTGTVKNYPRLRRHVWNLVAMVLEDMGYGKK